MYDITYNEVKDLSNSLDDKYKDGVACCCNDNELYFINYKRGSTIYDGTTRKECLLYVISSTTHNFDTFNENCIVLQEGINHKTIISNSTEINPCYLFFKDIFYYDKDIGYDSSIERYLGNGRNWIKLT